MPIHHLPAELAAGLYPPGPLAVEAVAYWSDTHLHADPACASASAVAESVVVFDTDPARFCLECNSGLPTGSSAHALGWVDAARELFDVSMESSDVRFVLNVASSWEELVVLAGLEERLGRLAAPPELRWWADALGDDIRRRQTRLAAVIAHGESSGTDPLTWALASDLTDVSEVPPWWPAVVDRLQVPLDAAPVEVGAALAASHRAPPRVVALLDRPDGSPREALLVGALRLRWFHHGRFGAVPDLVACWLVASRRAVDLGLWDPDAAASTLATADSVWDGTADSAPGALAAAQR
jgi:hypothetical protein